MLGYFLAALTGLSLGLLGGGGSILTVPILVYILHLDAKLSIALSLGIVGITSLVGIYNHYRNENVDFKIAAIFAPIAMGGTFLSAKLSQFVSGQIQLILFAIIMLLASSLMLKNGKKPNNEETESKEARLNYSLIIIGALLVGLLTGLVGVGGGFIIVPSLVLLAGISMKKAVGTSLLIISLNSFTGFAGYIGIVEIPWIFFAKFTLFSTIGILIGSSLVKFISQKRLKKAFAFFLIFMGIFILYKNKELFL